MSSKRKALVLGFARSGYEAAKLLAKKGYEVVINDAKAEQNADQVRELQNMGVRMVLGSHPEDLLDHSYEMLVKNPGISNHHSYVHKALELGIPVINEMELAFRYFPEGVTIIGITGTNGKTTTTTIIYELLKKASLNVYLMGNIGYPACSFVPVLKSGDIAVMEVSDHQLCNVMSFKTHISVMTNLSEAHIDFHGSYEAYKSMKKRIFSHHTQNDIAVLNLDDQEVLDLTEDIPSSKRYFSSRSMNENGCTVIDGWICYRGSRIIPVEEVRIKGQHNHENAMAAIAAVKELGVEDSVIIDVLRAFGGVEHRMEYVGTFRDIDFYNDSKSTNIKSTQIALASFSKPTILLLGGLDRGHSFDDLKEYLSHVKCIVSYGETSKRIQEFAISNRVPAISVDTLEEAVKAAYTSADKGDVVLLSPACASWDQFENFEIRGSKFKEYVRQYA